MKRSEVLFACLLLCVVPPSLYLMSNNTRYESNEITCILESDIFKLSYETLSINKSITFEHKNIKKQIEITEVLSNSFSFIHDTKTYKIGIQSKNALVIEDGVNEIFKCDHIAFKM